MNKPRFSIRIKFLGVLSALLLACIGCYLAIALHTFKQDKTELVFDLNRSLVSGINNDLAESVHSAKDKLELFALTAEGGTGHLRIVTDEILKNDPNIVYISANNRVISQRSREFVRSDFLDTYGLPIDFFKEQFKGNNAIPIEEILKNGSAIWGFHVANLPPLIGVGKAVVIEAADRTPISQYAVIALIKADAFFQAGSHLKDNQIFMTDKKGNVLLTTKEVDSPILIKTALASQMSTEVLSFSENNRNWMGAFSKTKNGEMIVFSMIDESDAFAATQAFLKRSLLFASIAATLAFIAAILFSRSLTRPLEILVEGMQKVTDGELATRILVQSNDETSILASSFNKMITELQESRLQLEDINRDLEQKVKERTIELEDRNIAVKEAQEALLRTTRLASVGEIAARAAHEVLNPLTGMMTRLNIVKKRAQPLPEAETQMFKEILEAWVAEFKTKGFSGLVKSWEQKSSLNPEISLFQEDLENLLFVQKTLVERDAQISEDTQFLLSEAQRIGKIVQSMRSLSLVKSQRSKHSLHELLRDSVNIMGDLLYQKNIEVGYFFTASNDKVMLDKDEFIQSVTNLLRNSIQAIEHNQDAKQRVIDITTNEESTLLTVDIRDTGSGILPEHQANLFETQFSTKSNDEGTGLGLNISRRFIRAVGGDLFLLSSVPNSETTFRLAVPKARNNQPGAAA